MLKSKSNFGLHTSMRYMYLCLLLLCVSATQGFSTLVVKDLKVESLKNPIGIEVEKPRFSWKLESNERGISQKSYEIVVSTESNFGTVVWNSGEITSDKSVGIPYGGSALSPSTRYYWKVKIHDMSSREVSSTETAFFETGLMNLGWAGAKWLKTSETTRSTTTTAPITSYSVDMDISITSGAAGIIFGATDANNFFMWQINISNAAKPLLRPHTCVNGTFTNRADIDLTSLVNVQANQSYHVRIDITDNMATTYINNIKVDVRANPLSGNYGYGKLGFREYTTEQCYYDNVLVTSGGQILFSENFSDATNFGFLAGTVVDGKLKVTNTLVGLQKDASTTNLSFDIEGDMTIVNHCASLIFSASDQLNFYMWQFNLLDDATSPLIKRHTFVAGAATVTTANIGSFFTNANLLNSEHHIKISVRQNTITTYIDNVLVDTYQDTQNKLFLGSLGIRAYKGGNYDEKAYWDNISVTNTSTTTPTLVLSENFENDDYLFNDMDVVSVNGSKKLSALTSNGDLRSFDNNIAGIPMFRNKFTLSKTIQSARLYSSGLGVYDVFINGQRVGSPTSNGMVYDELKPGWTDYLKTVFYSTYDVTALLSQGNNAIGSQVSSGWWAGEISYNRYGVNPSLGFIARLDVKYTDGSSETFVTNTSTWTTSRKGAVKYGNIYNGEVYDARKESAWTTADYDDATWYQTLVNTEFKGEIKPLVGPSVQVRKQLERVPQKISLYEGITNTGTTYGMINEKATYSSQTSITLKKGQTVVYDLGQNGTGWARFKVKGGVGTKMRVRFAEMLNDNGSSSRGNDGAGGSLYITALREAKATVFYTLKGSVAGEEYRPSMSFFGFRYCEVTATQDITLDYLVGEVVGNEIEENSSFVTSHKAVNQLYSNICWGQRSNFLSLPTDCPQRNERHGWTGDIQVFSRTATYSGDIDGFLRKWMGDMRASQRDDGAYPDMAPYIREGFGSAGWAEAGIIIPWTAYLMYNDTQILEENLASMEKYMAFLAAQSGSGFLYNGAAAKWNDWLAYVATDGTYISVCYYAYAAQLMEKICLALSTLDNDTYKQKATTYRTLYNNIKTEFQGRYVNTDGTLKQNTQTAYLLALKFDLFPTESARTNAVKQLETLISTNGNKLNTGFLGTGILNQTLSEVGLINSAYNLLLQRDNPSWLYSVDQGATTIWERWNSYTTATGFGNAGMNSFNHYANGAVGEWMFRYMGGINPDENNPAFKHIVLNPTPDFRTTLPAGQERITKTDASYNSYYGMVRCAWEMNGEKISYKISIPANTTADVYLPLYNETDTLIEGGRLLSQDEGIVTFNLTPKKTFVQLKSGDYVFEIGKALVITPSVNLVSVTPNGSHLNIEANATEINGSISKVMFFDGATKLGETTSTSSIYTFEIENLVDGSHTITAVAVDNYNAEATSSSITINFTSVSNQSMNLSVKVYPNPVDSKLYIESKKVINSVELYNSLGALIYSQNSGATIDMKSWNSGTYYAQIRTLKTTEIVKVIKK